MYCERCLTDVPNDDYIYGGKVVCKDCYEHAFMTETIIEFIEAYPKPFIEYLKESLTADMDLVRNMLEDYCSWQVELYDKWVMS